jgi:NAD(P)-dependent dehydrogenase (short-subunit alcohol dehydrogenase family)
MQKTYPKRTRRILQEQRRPGFEFRMKPVPVFENKKAPGSFKLRDKVALITGGDSGIGRAVAVLFAKEGADVVIIYLNEKADALETKRIIEMEHGRKCYAIAADISKESNCNNVVARVIKRCKSINILVNNAGIHYQSDGLEEISSKQLIHTFATNVFSMFWITRAVLKVMPPNSSIINTASVTAYRGSPGLIDYAATKGAIVSFTRSLSANLAPKKIRVNGVAPGPIWTPLIVSSFSAKKNAQFGTDVPLKRAGEPYEVAPAYLFLAADDSSYMTGQFLHPNGGEIVNG